MLIALVTPTLGRDGGVAAHALASAAALAEAGHRVQLIVGRVQPGHETSDAVVMPELAADTRSAADVTAVAQAVAAARPEVVHLHDVAELELIRALAMVAPVVASAHGYPGCSPNTYYFEPGHECERAHGPLCVGHMAVHGCLHARTPWRIPALYRATTRRLAALRSADAVIGYSNAVMENLRRNGLADAHLVPLFTTLDAPRGQAGEPGRTILFAGRVIAAKGLDVLIRALAEVDDATLVVCGDGWALPAARRLAASMGVEPRVDFRGWTAPDRLGAHLEECDVVAVPSLWPEPFGLVGIEAFAHERPVVASRTGGITDWLIEGETGRLVDPGDVAGLARVLTELLSEPGLRREMGAAGRKLVEQRFTAQTHVAALERVYASAAERR